MQVQGLVAGSTISDSTPQYWSDSFLNSSSTFLARSRLAYSPSYRQSRRFACPDLVVFLNFSPFALQLAHRDTGSMLNLACFIPNNPEACALSFQTTLTYQKSTATGRGFLHPAKLSDTIGRFCRPHLAEPPMQLFRLKLTPPTARAIFLDVYNSSLLDCLMNRYQSCLRR
jgi:hypothetical protein